MKTHTVLAIGAHVGDAELTAGALLASCAVYQEIYASQFEAEEVRSCVAMSLFDRYEMTFDELKRRMQLLMRPSAYQELMDKWSSMPKADLDLECARFLRRMYDLSGFMKIVSAHNRRVHVAAHTSSEAGRAVDAIWEERSSRLEEKEAYKRIKEGKYVYSSNL